MNNILVKMYVSSNCLVKNRSLLVMFSILLPSPLGQNLPSYYFSHRIRISAAPSMLSIFQLNILYYHSQKVLLKDWVVELFLKSRFPQSHGKLKCHSLQGVLGGKLSIYFHENNSFYGLVQKLQKSILSLSFYSFHIFSILSFLLWNHLEQAHLQGQSRLGRSGRRLVKGYFFCPLPCSIQIIPLPQLSH